MESNEKLKEIDNKNCTNYHFDDISKFEQFDFENIFIEENSYEYILVYNIPCKSLTGSYFCVLGLIT